MRSSETRKSRSSVEESECVHAWSWGVYRTEAWVPSSVNARSKWVGRRRSKIRMLVSVLLLTQDEDGASAGVFRVKYDCVLGGTNDPKVERYPCQRRSSSPRDQRIHDVAVCKWVDVRGTARFGRSIQDKCSLDVAGRRFLGILVVESSQERFSCKHCLN